MNNKRNKKITIVLAIFIVFAGFLFFSNSTYAQEESYDPGSTEITNSVNDSGINGSKTLDQAAQSQTTDACSAGSLMSHPIKSMITCPLLMVLKFEGWLLEMAIKIFGWVANADKLKAVLDNNAIYTVWKDVRDFLNIGFILILLYSAFSIIFQVGGKFGEKKIILTIVLMALLVNFSYPISRFIIDVGNTLMYTLLDGYFGQYAGNPEKILTDPQNGLGFTALQEIIAPKTSNPDISLLLASIVFIFILTITILALGVLLLIRIIALAILIIFSPVAFVGSIIGKGGQWWDYLFKYTFFGPVMVFMLVVAIRLMHAMGELSIDGSGLSNDSDSLVTAMARMVIPIVILWIGMGVAQSSTFSIAGAGGVLGRAQKIAGWAGKNLGGARPLAAWGFKKAGISGGVKQKWDNFKKTGILGSERQAQREAAIAGKGPFAVKGAVLSDMKKRAEELKKNNVDKAELLNRANNGDAAAAYRLAMDGDIDATAYKGAMDNIKDKSLRDAIEGKTREKRVDVVIDYVIHTQGATTPAAMQNIAEQEIGKIAPSKWKDQNINELTGYDPTTNTFSADPNTIARRNAAQAVYTRTNPKNKDKITDDMSGDKYAAGQQAGIWP